MTAISLPKQEQQIQNNKILDQVRLIMLHQKLKASNQQHFTTMESMIGILYPIRSNPSMICKDLKKK